MEATLENFKKLNEAYTKMGLSYQKARYVSESLKLECKRIARDIRTMRGRLVKIGLLEER